MTLLIAPWHLIEVLVLGCTWDKNSSFRPVVSSRIDPDPLGKSFHLFSCVFTSFLGVILPKTDQRCTFNANLEQKKTIFEAFGKLWEKTSVKNAFLAGFGQSEAQISRKYVEIRLKGPFSGVWVHQLGEICQFEVKPLSSLFWNHFGTIWLCFLCWFLVSLWVYIQNKA